MPDPRDQQRFVRAQEILARVRDLPPDERPTLAKQACGDDAFLRAEVESLLHAEGSMEGFLEGSRPGEALRAQLEGASLEDSTEDSALPARIGPYRVVRLLGEGGMGAVYEAEQVQPRRSVALKVLRIGLGSSSAVRRFEREAEFLGQLSHPAIAKLFQFGVHRDDGGGATPWFAMELVDGSTIIQHANANGLTPRQRVELLLKVCDAVAHAHAQGIVHRDLKPDNILIDASGLPRVLDFGVARAVRGPEAPATLLTSTGDIVGTLSYMSPEQACGDPAAVDARTDIYSLGVVAFELLTGRLPHDIDDLPLADALGRIRDAETDRLRAVDPSLSGDLDVIVSKALEQERERRYGTVSELVDDLRRHLAHEPIVARPASVAYRISRFARRNRAVVAGVVGVMSTLAFGVVISTQLALNEAAQRRRADDAALEATKREQEALWSQYRAQLAAAGAALADGDLAGARRMLAEAPSRFRGWEWRHLHARVEPSLGQAQLLSGYPIDLAFSRGGDVLVGVSDGGISHLRVPTLEVLATWPAENGDVVKGLSADGERALVQRGREASLLILATGERFVLEPRLTDFFSFSDSGESIWVRSREDGEHALALSDGRTGRRLAELDLDRDEIWGELTRDDRLVTEVAPGTGEVARIRDAMTGRVLQPILGTRVTGPLVQTDDRLIGHVLDTGRTRGWELPTGRELDWRDRGAPLANLLIAIFSHDRHRLALLHFDGSTRLLDGRDGRPIASLARVDVAAFLCRPVFSADGTLLAVAGANNGIVLVDPEDATPRGRLAGHERALHAIEFSPDGLHVASVDRGGLVRSWDVSATGEPTTLRGHASYVYDVAFNADGTRIASSAWDGTVRIWDTASGEPTATLRSPSRSRRYGRVAWHPDGTRLLSVHGETVTLWDVRTGEALFSELIGELALGPGPQTEPFGIAWHPSGDRVVVGSLSRELALWTLPDTSSTSDDQPAERTTWPMPAEAVAFSPDGRLLATSTGNSVELWDVATHRRVATLPGTVQKTRRVAFSPSSRFIAAASDDGTVRTWSVEDAQPVHVLQAHSEQAYAVAWSPDGKRLATGGSDRVIRLWDVPTGDFLAVLRGHERYVHALAWSPDGELLVSGSGDGTVRIWETAPAHLRVLARRERRQRQAELRSTVSALTAELRDRRAIVERIETLSGLDDADRRLALDLVLEHGAER